MSKLVETYQWTSSNSLHTTEFGPKPLIEVMSILIPTLGRPILEQSLFWILNGSAWPGCLIVVEQGANPDVAGWLSRVQQLGIRVRHILSQQRGRSAGINRGLEQVDTRFVAITDDDCFVGQDWLRNMARRLELSPEAVVTGQVEPAGDGVVMVMTSNLPSMQTHPRLSFDCMSGGNVGTSMSVFRKAGLFDEDPVLATAEDVEWAYRALRKGVSIRYEPDIVVKHFGWRDTGMWSEQYRSYALSHGGFYGKYLRRGDFFILARAAVHFARSLRRWARGRWSGQTEQALLGRAYCLYLLPGILAGLRSTSAPGKLA